MAYFLYLAQQKGKQTQTFHKQHVILLGKKKVNEKIWHYVVQNEVNLVILWKMREKINCN